jgi:hypothetical protein
MLRRDTLDEEDAELLFDGTFAGNGNPELKRSSMLKG